MQQQQTRAQRRGELIGGIVAFAVVFVGIAGSAMFGASFGLGRCNLLDDAAPVWRVTPLARFGQCAVDFTYADGAFNGTLQAPCPSEPFGPVPTQYVAVCYSASDAGRYDAAVDASKMRGNLVSPATLRALRFAGLAMAIPLWVLLASLIFILSAGTCGSKAGDVPGTTELQQKDGADGEVFVVLEAHRPPGGGSA